jgi:hypothetical protein
MCRACEFVRVGSHWSFNGDGTRWAHTNDLRRWNTGDRTLRHTVRELAEDGDSLYGAEWYRDLGKRHW